MKPTLTLLATITLLLPLGISKGYAQREDTLKTFRLPAPLPTTTNPFQVLPDKKLGYPGQLSIDGLDIPHDPKEEKPAIPQNLSIAHYLKYFEKDFRKREKEKYGAVLDLKNFVYKEGAGGLMSLIPDNPSQYITFWWPPTKEDIWFEKNFATYKNTYGLAFYIDTLHLNDAEILQKKWVIDSVIMIKKARQLLYPDSTLMQLKIPRRKRAVYW